MAFDLAKRVKKAFQNTGPKNPLNKLREGDKCLLWAWLMVYSSCEMKPKKRSDFVNRLEQAAQIAADAAAFATRIQAQVFQGQFAEPLRPFLVGFQDLPLRLHAFASRLGGVLGSYGKAGHKERMLNNRHLVTASEFVRLRTGEYYDEHLAELYQAIRMEESDLKDFSGDAIRKKRNHFIKTYPLLYRHAMKEVLKHRPREEEQASSMDIFGQAFLSGMREGLDNSPGVPSGAPVKPREDTASGGPRSRSGGAQEPEASQAGREPRSGRRSVRARTQKIERN